MRGTAGTAGTALRGRSCLHTGLGAALQVTVGEHGPQLTLDRQTRVRTELCLQHRPSTLGRAKAGLSLQANKETELKSLLRGSPIDWPGSSFKWTFKFHSEWAPINTAALTLWHKEQTVPTALCIPSPCQVCTPCTAQNMEHSLCTREPLEVTPQLNTLPGLEHKHYKPIKKQPLWWCTGIN